MRSAVMPSLKSPFHLAALLLAFLPTLISAANGQTNYTLVSDAFSQLANLKLDPPSKLKPRYGGRDPEHCCLLAVNSSLEVVNGSLEQSPNSFIQGSLDQLIAANQSGQFPCGASYNGDRSGTIEVVVPYTWCNAKCSGWQKSHSSKLNQWVGPFVGFIIPAVVFCLAIPRRRKLRINSWLFHAPMDRLSNLFKVPFIATTAAILVTIDTVVWLSICFALAGPMLLSGIYEAFIDSRILSYLYEKCENGNLTVDMRARILYLVLAGNLDLETVPQGETPDSAAWNHVQGLTNGLQIYPDTRQHPLNGEKAFNITVNQQDLIETTKTRLRTMLACQYSFGSTVGAPVVFFAGAFIYTLVDTLSHLGDNDTSHALAFGMWWMVIPHISIVSGFLLAGNNPNTLEGVVGRRGGPREQALFGIFELVYESRYRPAWMWFRGRSKRDWTERVLSTYIQAPMGGNDPDMELFKKRTKFTMSDWATVGSIVYALILIPDLLAFLTSYNTPRIGLGCRSLTFLVYAICQLWLMLLWIWKFNSRSKKPSWRYLWNALTILGGLGAVFTAIGGTMMQIMGVYRNCYCDLPIQYWGNERDPGAWVTLSTNTKLDIEKAATYWKGSGGGAIAFLGLICYSGWWYQRRLKGVFGDMVGKIDVNARLS
ncbi:hypothetical protein FGG08_003963 [Glutinoglossum americanum]|uniref:Uncharacterized protein n=1 Tax=Glutinoglossum americanum TaxID=1670608 RepID=A0A9P8L4B4_9PEZI|nr:hypothetical protein FGG08_003963 [Glutinoglossum americanum]